MLQIGSMWNLRRRGTSIALAALLLGSALSIGAAVAQDAPSPDNPVKITLGTIPIAPLIPAFMAVQNGYFAEEGLEVELRPEPGGQDIITAVFAREFDFGFSNQTSLLIARAAGLDMLAIANGVVGEPDVESAWDGLIVPSDSPIQGPNDLIGKTVSVNTLNNTPHLVVLRALENAGIEDPASKIRFIEVQFPDAVGAVTAGQIDAAWVVEPFVTVGSFNDTRVVMRPLIETAPNFLMSAYFTSAKLVEENPELVHAFQRAINKGMQFAIDNPDAVREAFPQFNTNASPQVAAQMALPVWKTTLTPEDFQMGAELAQRYGFIEEIPDLDSFVYRGAE